MAAVKPADIAAGYRKRATPKSVRLADLLAARWEARAGQLDDDAEMYEAQSRQQDGTRHEIQPEN